MAKVKSGFDSFFKDVESLDNGSTDCLPSKLDFDLNFLLTVHDGNQPPVTIPLFSNSNNDDISSAYSVNSSKNMAPQFTDLCIEDFFEAKEALNSTQNSTVHEQDIIRTDESLYDNILLSTNSLLLNKNINFNECSKSSSGCILDDLISTECNTDSKCTKLAEVKFEIPDNLFDLSGPFSEISLKSTENISKYGGDSYAVTRDEHLSLDDLAAKFLKDLPELSDKNTEVDIVGHKGDTELSVLLCSDDMVLNGDSSAVPNIDAGVDLSLCLKEARKKCPNSTCSSVDSGFCEGASPLKDFDASHFFVSDFSSQHFSPLQKTKPSLLASSLSCKRKSHASKKRKIINIAINFQKDHYPKQFGVSQKLPVPDTIIDQSNNYVMTSSFMNMKGL